MFKLLHPLPHRVLLACSGGVDSMAAFHWLRRSDKLAGVIHINHGTGAFANEAEDFVRSVCREYGMFLRWEKIEGTPPIGESKEKWWRDQRYAFFYQHAQLEDLKVVTAHNLNDCVEEYVINSIVRGRQGVIPYSHGPVIRPFRTWSRHLIEEYAKRNQLKWVNDPSNVDRKYLRNMVRHEILPNLRKINLGLDSMVRRMIECEGLD